MSFKRVCDGCYLWKNAIRHGGKDGVLEEDDKEWERKRMEKEEISFYFNFEFFLSYFNSKIKNFDAVIFNKHNKENSFFFFQDFVFKMKRKEVNSLWYFHI